MAMIKCKECGEDVSDRAKRCPHCGTPYPGVTWKNVIIGLSIFFIFCVVQVLYCFMLAR